MGTVRDYFNQKVNVREIDSDRTFVYDVRRYGELPEGTVDMKMFGAGKNLTDVCQENGLDTTRMTTYENRWKAILRSLEIAEVDRKAHPVQSFAPVGFFADCEAERLNLLEKLSRHELKVKEYDSWIGETWKAMVEIERSGVYLDGKLIVDGMKHEDPIQRNFFKSMFSTADDDDYAHPRLHPLGSRTYRFRVESGLQVMSIPHGDVRKAVISRFDGGSICSIDYNAMDYRSMVRWCDDPELRKVLGESEDFHAATYEMLFGRMPDKLERDQMKSLLYVYVYGGSTKTLCDKTGLPSDVIAKTLRRIEESRLSSIGRLKSKVVAAARQGMLISGGHALEVKEDDHDGKVMGLWAQTASSVSFREAFVSVAELLRKRRSRLLFPVHDELVLDVHPEESQRGLIEEIKATMEGVGSGVRLTASATSGRNYHEATD